MQTNIQLQLQWRCASIKCSTKSYSWLSRSSLGLPVNFVKILMVLDKFTYMYIIGKPKYVWVIHDYWLGSKFTKISMRFVFFQNFNFPWWIVSFSFTSRAINLYALSTFDRFWSFISTVNHDDRFLILLYLYIICILIGSTNTVSKQWLMDGTRNEVNRTRTLQCRYYNVVIYNIYISILRLYNNNPL